MIEICPKCNQPFELGANGTIEGCDACTGVQRDKHGYAWYPEETYHVYQSVSNENQFTWAKRPGVIK